MLSALRNLKSALDESLISSDEYDHERKIVLAGDFSRWTDPAADASTESKRLQHTVDTLVSMMAPEASSQVSVTHNEQLTSSLQVVTKKSKAIVKDGSILVVPRARDSGQPSILDLGVTVQEIRKDGRVNLLSEAQFKEPQALQQQFRCKYAGCSRTFARACHLANHEKKAHGMHAMEKPRSVLQMTSVRKMMSDAQARMKVEVDILQESVRSSETWCTESL